MSGRAARAHRVSVPYPAVISRAHLARCLCGWGYTYDLTTYRQARQAAEGHVQDAYLQTLAGVQ